MESQKIPGSKPPTKLYNIYIYTYESLLPNILGKNISKHISWDDDIPNMMETSLKKKSMVPIHQPDRLLFQLLTID